MAIDLSDPVQRQRYEGRERRETQHVAARVRLLAAEGMSPEEIAAEVKRPPCRVRAILERSRKLRADHVSADPGLPQFLTIGQVRRALGDPPLAYATVRKLIARSGLPVIALPGKLMLIPKRSFLDWLASRAVKDRSAIDWRAKKRARDRERQARLRQGEPLSADMRAMLATARADSQDAIVRAAEKAGVIVRPAPARQPAPARRPALGPAPDLDFAGSGIRDL